MTLLHLLLLLVIAGVALYVLNAVVPLDGTVKRIINVLVLAVLGIVTLVWLLGWLGVDLNGPALTHGPRVR